MATLPSAASLGARPAPQSGRSISGYDGGAVGRAMEGAGQALGGLADKLDAIEQRKQNAQAAITLARLNNDLHDAHDKTAQGISDGSLDPTAALKQFREQSAKLTSERLQGVAPRQREHITANTIATTGALERNLGGVVLKRGQSDMAATIDEMGEQTQRDAYRIGPQMASEKYNSFVDFAGSDAGLNPAQKQQLKQAHAERVHYSYFNSLGEKALEAGDSAALKTLRERVAGPDGETIDPTRRTQLAHQLFGYEQHIEAKKLTAMNAAERERVQRENTAIEYRNKTIDLVVNGQKLSPEWIKEATTAAAGTEQAAGIGLLLAGQSPIAGFATKPAAERAALLERFRNEAATTGTDPLGHAMVKQLTTINDSLATKAKENPWTAAQGAGVIPDAPAFDASALEVVGPMLLKRMESIAQVEAWAGHKVSPLQPQEVQQITTKLKTLPPEQAADFLGGLGAQLGNPERVAQVADQLDQGNKPLSLALKLGTDRTTAGRAVSALVLKGETALKDKTVKRDDATLTGWRADISAKVRGTLGDKQMEDDIIDAAYYVRAAMDEPGYQFKPGTEQALKLVIGEPLERGGVKTILPRGMDENAFTEKLRAYTPDKIRAIAPEVYVRGQKRTPEQLSSALPGMGMRRNGKGQYAPVDRGNAFVTLDPQGQIPLLLDIR